jgi:peptide/nickel transport system substrate-binding protein
MSDTADGRHTDSTAPERFDASRSDRERRRHSLASRGFVVAAAAGAIAALTANAAATGRQTDSARSAASSTTPLVVNMAQAAATIDPAEVCNSYDTGLVGTMYARLTQYAVKPGPLPGTTEANPGTIIPWLAKSWTVSNHGLTYTFHLRPGLKFPSGHPVDAQAVKYTFDRLLTANGCGAAYLLDDIFTPPLVKKVVAPNPTTVVLKLSQPDVNVPQDLAQPGTGIVDPSVVQAHGGVKKNTPNQWMASHDAGYGPYLLSSYLPNHQAVLVANPGFFAPPPSKKIIVNYISDDATLLLQARSGQADVTLGLSKQSVASLRKSSCCRIVVTDTPTWETLELPNKHAPFTSKVFREALTYAVPYQDILNKVAFGYARLYYGPWPPDFSIFNPTVGGPRPFDLAKAKSLMAQSGVKTPVDITLSVTEGNPIEREIATIVQGVWAQLGVHVSVSILSASAFTNDVEAHKLQAFLRYDGPSVLAPDYLWGYDAECNVSYNLSEICIPAADKIVAQLRKTTNPGKRHQLADEAARLWIADSPRIQVYADRFTAVVNNRVKHYYFSPSDLFYPIAWSK